MQFKVARAHTIFQDDHVVAKITRAARRALDTAFGGDAADQNRFDAIAADLSIEFWPM